MEVSDALLLIGTDIYYPFKKLMSNKGLAAISYSRLKTSPFISYQHTKDLVFSIFFLGTFVAKARVNDRLCFTLLFFYLWNVLPMPHF